MIFGAIIILTFLFATLNCFIHFHHNSRENIKSFSMKSPKVGIKSKSTTGLCRHRRINLDMMLDNIVDKKLE